MLKGDPLIIGGGIAGLSAAIGFSQHGYHPLVLEQSSAYRPVGLGFILLPNGTETFRAFGIEEELEKNSCRIDSFILKSREGKILKIQKMDPLVGIFRSTCLRLLREQIPDKTIIMKAKFSHFEQGETGSVAVCIDGTKYEGSFYVGADGAKSAVRRSLYPDFPIHMARVKELVGFLEAPEEVEKLGSSFLKISYEEGGLTAGLVPVTKTSLVWYIQFDSMRWTPPNEKDPLKMKSFALRLLSLLNDPFPSIIERSDFSLSHLWHPFDINLPPKFYGEKIVLIGDAAHTFIPFTSQGASSGLEDGKLLPQYLDRYKGEKNWLQSSFEAYESDRRPFMEKYVTGGRWLSVNFLDRTKDKNHEVPYIMDF